MKFLLILISFSSFAGFDDLPMDAYHYKFDEKPKKKKITKKRVRKKNNVDALLSDINKNDLAISEFLKASEKRLIVKKSKSQVKSLTRLRGVLLNSIIATNRRPTTLVIRLKENEFFDDAEVRCMGTSYGKRVVGNCNLIVSEKEYEVTAELWDMDGAEGVIADQFYDGSEKEFLTSSFAAFLTGALDASKDRIMTSNGQMELNNPKNKVLSGLMGIGSNVGKKVQDSAEKNLQIALINSGKEVYVFFQKGVEI